MFPKIDIRSPEDKNLDETLIIRLNQGLQEKSMHLFLESFHDFSRIEEDLKTKLVSSLWKEFLALL